MWGEHWEKILKIYYMENMNVRKEQKERDSEIVPRKRTKYKAMNKMFSYYIIFQSLHNSL